METTIRTRKGEVTVRENVLDRAIGYFSPKTRLQRFHSRTMLAIAGGFLGASRTKRSLASFTPRTNDADADLLMDLPFLRDRARSLDMNAPIAGGAVETMTMNVVGTGLKLRARIDRKTLGMNQEEADAWESETEREFALWAESQECDIARTLTFEEMQELAFRSMLVSGDSVVLLPMVPIKGFPYDLRVQVLEGDRLSNPDHKVDTPGLAGGVERDEKTEAPVAYWICSRHPGSRLGCYNIKNWKRVDAFGKKTGRRNVLHLYRKERPGQSRGIPFLAPVIDLLKQLSNYTDAEMQAAVIASFFTVFIKSELGEDLAPMEPTSETGGTASDPDYKMGPAAILGLRSGEDVTTADPKRPNQAFDGFVQSILRQIGVRLGLPYEILIKHFTASYSAARAALQEAWKTYKNRRAFLEKRFCRPIYEAWMMEAVTGGRIRAPGFLTDSRLRKAYLGAIWVGPSKGMINEKDEVGAAVARVDSGLSTLEHEAAELTGLDWELILEQRAREHRLRAEAGLEPAMAGSKTPASGSAPPDPSQTQNQDLPEGGDQS